MDEPPGFPHWKSLEDTEANGDTRVEMSSGRRSAYSEGKDDPTGISYANLEDRLKKSKNKISKPHKELTGQPCLAKRIANNPRDCGSDACGCSDGCVHRHEKLASTCITVEEHAHLSSP